ncbi:MAG: bifunctional diaminohydroxyphosphoribosylaminopyrimidine deaminase/5-amino-6-(5-phosphoribosylamino)uracil reductase RibD [Verrucomicrobia bacterium]|nr:bifunctional diaminohydroxyphosphoribosylaminopyrimidine deaminase/5-amino-6-(5-phosphoribosylamino)uracil reductase RibD [Verrucomicrobiota bacterium]
MRIALREAQKGLGRCSPNPAVGAVIVKSGRLLSKGYHRKAGRPHAEIEALRGVADPAETRGATLFVTLEPCSTFGRTPPCTEAIIRTGIRHVVIGTIDRNPNHAGRGVEQLRAAGISVQTGILETQCRLLNVGFDRWISAQRPWVIVKIAQSIDGRITRPPGEPTRITGATAHRRVQQLRATVDAILVGAETLRRDNPKLTVRGIRAARQPWRVVVTRKGNLPSDAILFTDQFRERTLVYRDRTWKDILADLGQRGVTRLLVEGGGEVLGELLDADLIDEVWSFFAPCLIGGDKPSFGGRGVSENAAAKPLHYNRFERFGDDLLVRGLVHEALEIPTSGLRVPV